MRARTWVAITAKIICQHVNRTAGRMGSVSGGTGQLSIDAAGVRLTICCDVWLALRGRGQGRRCEPLTEASGVNQPLVEKNGQIGEEDPAGDIEGRVNRGGRGRRRLPMRLLGDGKAHICRANRASRHCESSSGGRAGLGERWTSKVRGQEGEKRAFRVSLSRGSKGRTGMERWWTTSGPRAKGKTRGRQKRETERDGLSC